MSVIRVNSELLSLITSAQISVYRLTVHFSGAPIHPLLQAAVILTWNKKKEWATKHTGAFLRTADWKTVQHPV